MPQKIVLFISTQAKFDPFSRIWRFPLVPPSSLYLYFKKILGKGQFQFEKPENSLTGSYWALLGLTGLYWALLGLTGSYWALLGLYWAFFNLVTNWLTNKRTLRLIWLLSQPKMAISTFKLIQNAKVGGVLENFRILKIEEEIWQPTYVEPAWKVWGCESCLISLH